MEKPLCEKEESYIVHSGKMGFQVKTFQLNLQQLCWTVRPWVWWDS